MGARACLDGRPSKLSLQVQSHTLFGCWHAPCELATAGRRRAGRASNRGHRDAQIDERGRRTTARPPLACCRGWSCPWPHGGAARPAEDTIKVGILHSLSGTMAISETTLKDVMLMLIDEQNKKGGVLGKKLEAVVVDPASNWPLFAEKARELISKDKVAVVFGCWTSVSRKSVLPVFKELNSILFYPVQYEGEESERNVFYTGAAPNQQAIPAVDYLMSADGGIGEALGAGRHRLRLSAHDQQDPRSLPQGRAKGWRTRTS